jgi:hypothetical protein
MKLLPIVSELMAAGQLPTAAAYHKRIAASGFQAQPQSPKRMTNIPPAQQYKKFVAAEVKRQRKQAKRLQDAGLTQEDLL